MKIDSVLFVAGLSAYYFDDQRAIKKGATHDGFLYTGNTITQGFTSVRQSGELISVLLQLENGQYAVGDCCAVQYSGAGGRDPLFLAEQYLAFLQDNLAPKLVGMQAEDFLVNTRKIDALTFEDKPIHTAIRYGISQALLDAAALSQNKLKVEVVCEQYGLDLPTSRVPLFGQSGDDRYDAVDKMLLRSIDALPHGLINNIPDKLGYRGEKLTEYVQWIITRIEHVRSLLSFGADYKPDIHLDVYGTLGQLYENDIDRIFDYLCELNQASANFNLYIEGPVDLGEKNAQIECMLEITQRINKSQSGLFIVADEWCNTKQDIIDFVDAGCCHMAQIKTPDLGSIHNVVESVLYCKDNGIQAYQGGTCNESDISSRVCVHLALATQPERLLVKPGMGFDEGMQIVNNEMNRTLAQINARRS